MRFCQTLKSLIMFCLCTILQLCVHCVRLLSSHHLRKYRISTVYILDSHTTIVHRRLLGTLSHTFASQKEQEEKVISCRALTYSRGRPKDFRYGSLDWIWSAGGKRIVTAATGPIVIRSLRDFASSRPLTNMILPTGQVDLVFTSLSVLLLHHQSFTTQ